MKKTGKKICKLTSLIKISSLRGFSINWYLLLFKVLQVLSKYVITKNNPRGDILSKVDDYHKAKRPNWLKISYFNKHSWHLFQDSQQSFVLNAKMLHVLLFHRLLQWYFKIHECSFLHENVKDITSNLWGN